MTHHVFFIVFMCLMTNHMFVIKHINTQKTHDVLFQCACVLGQNTWHPKTHVTCKRNKKYMSHVSKGFMCVEVKYVNTKKTCHVEKVFMCFSMEHVNTKETCHMAKFCFCVFAQHVWQSLFVKNTCWQISDINTKNTYAMAQYDV